MSKKTHRLRIAFCGDREIAVAVLQHLLNHDTKPLALMVPESSRASHADALINLCSFLHPDKILVGQAFRQPAGIEILSKLDLDFIIGVHFPYVIPSEMLSIPREGFLNLHPGFLPYNRGWHTPSWAILEDTPIGATLHFMDEGIDTGDIIHQKQLDISPGDTAHSLYQRLMRLEFEVFEEAWPQIVSGTYVRKPQDPRIGTMHRRKDLFTSDIQQIDLDAEIKANDLLKKLRALTTNQISEAAYFIAGGKRYRVQVIIHEE
jgi:methionyl-tRNA formyltransferase